jgi:peptidoglycan/LPS O-acetylase OafA/YrhL
MGALRLFIALAVLLGHYKLAFLDSYMHGLFPYLMGEGLDGAIKVNCFFIIAGFYTQLMLQEKFVRPENRAIRFYLFRLLRLMPAYYLVLGLTALLGFYCFSHGIKFAEIYSVRKLNSTQGVIENLLVYVPTIFKFGAFRLNEVEHYLVLWHTWALTVEIIFLILAPLFLLNIKRFYFLAAVSIALAIYYLQIGLVRNYFGASLIYFMAGCVGYKYYKANLAESPFRFTNAITAYGIILIIAIMMLYFRWISSWVGVYPAYFSLMGLVVFTLPFIAAFTKNIPLDRFIGEWAYPIYLSHYLFISLIKIFKIYYTFSILVVIAGCIGFALFDYFIINKPMTRFRRAKLL